MDASDISSGAGGAGFDSGDKDIVLEGGIIAAPSGVDVYAGEGGVLHDDGNAHSSHDLSAVARVAQPGDLPAFPSSPDFDATFDDI